MGVRGLQTFMEKHCPGAFLEFDIAEEAEKYREETGSDPVIVMDVASCLRHIYVYEKLDWLSGGQFKELAKAVKFFIDSFKSIGVQLVLFFDGMPVPRKHTVWVTRRMEALKNVYEIYDFLKQGNFRGALNVRNIQLPVLAWETVKSTFIDSVYCKCYCALREADDEIAEYAASHNCFAILGQDTDYVILTGPRFYVSIQHFDVRSMTSRWYSRSGLARHLGLDEKMLPLFATLCGNDVVPFQEVVNFHRRLCKSKSFERGRGMVPFQDLFPTVAHFVRRNGSNPNLKQISNEVFRSPERDDLIRLSLESYTVAPDPEEKLRHVFVSPSPWQEILSEARLRHVTCKARVYIYTVLSGWPLYLSSGLEDLRDKRVTPSGLATRPLRQRLYGILLKEKPHDGDEDDAMVEWIMHGEGSLDQPTRVKPIYPEHHIGLLNLWNESESEFDDARWSMFCLSVSVKLDPLQLKSLPRTIVIPVLCLFYLCHELKEQSLMRWEVEVFLAVAVHLQNMTAEDTRRFKPCGTCDARAIHLSTLYQRTCQMIETLSAACGHPLSQMECQGMHFFDGKLYQSTYKQAKLSHSASDLCDSREAEVELFKRVLALVKPEIRIAFNISLNRERFAGDE